MLKQTDSDLARELAASFAQEEQIAASAAEAQLEADMEYAARVSEGIGLHRTKSEAGREALAQAVALQEQEREGINTEAFECVFFAGAF